MGQLRVPPTQSDAHGRVRAFGELVARSCAIIDILVESLVDAVETDWPDVRGSVAFVKSESSRLPTAAALTDTVRCSSPVSVPGLTRSSEEYDELVHGESRVADECAQQPASEFPVVRNRQSSKRLRCLPQLNVTSTLSVDGVADLPEGLHRVSTGDDG